MCPQELLTKSEKLVLFAVPNKEEGTVRNVVQFVQHDQRIKSVCSEVFPNAPEFCEYLARRIAATNGSVRVAQILCSTLKQLFPRAPPVSAFHVLQFSLDSSEEDVGRMHRASPLSSDMIGVNGMIFLMAISGEMRVPKEMRNLDQIRILPHRAVSEIKKDRLAWARIFYCAQAMLVHEQATLSQTL